MPVLTHEDLFKYCRFPGEPTVMAFPDQGPEAALSKKLAEVGIVPTFYANEEITLLTEAAGVVAFTCPAGAMGQDSLEIECFVLVDKSSDKVFAHCFLRGVAWKDENIGEARAALEALSRLMCPGHFFLDSGQEVCGFMGVSLYDGGDPSDLTCRLVLGSIYSAATFGKAFVAAFSKECKQVQ